MKETERELKGKIRRYLNTILNGKFVSYCPYPYGEAGTPDYIGCIDGKMILIEVKAQGKKLNPNQILRKKQWKKAGASVYVACDIKQLKELI